MEELIILDGVYCCVVMVLTLHHFAPLLSCVDVVGTLTVGCCGNFDQGSGVDRSKERVPASKSSAWHALDMRHSNALFG